MASEDRIPAPPSPDIQATVRTVQTDIPVTPSLSDLATVSHQKGDVQMITVTREKLEATLSASGSISSNFLTLMIGTALTLFIALKSGGVAEEWKGIFWVSFYFSLVLVAFFGVLTVNQELAKRRLRRELRKLPSTPLR